MPFTGSCAWENHDPEKQSVSYVVSDYMFLKYGVVLCAKDMKKFKKLSAEERIEKAKGMKKFFPRYQYP